MAFALMLLRRARSLTGLPPVIPALGAPRTFQSVVRGILCYGKQTPSQGINSAASGFHRPTLRFATAADENLVRALESRIDSAGLPKEIIRIEVSLLYEIEIGRIPILVTITKRRNRQRLEFRLTASPHEFTIDGLSIRESEPPASSKEEVPFENPDFSELDCNTQKAFCDYLEAKGIKPTTLNFLHQGVANKDKTECPIWWNKVKNFVEK